jgi:regulator of sirC expression with transglutaminase-like and TPR domain
MLGHLAAVAAKDYTPRGMNVRLVVLAGAASLIVLAAGAGGWRMLHSSSLSDSAEQDEPLPVPPVPPRIAEGSEYDHCLSMLASDPEGANGYAGAWETSGGGEGAVHCHALAQIALGNAQTGAEIMQNLANASHDDNAARASLFGQTGQAWMMAGDTTRAYAAATLALTLDPDDPDLLVDHAVAAATLEHHKEAIQDLDRALEIEPRRADALVFRAAAQRHLDHLDLAQDDIDRALALDPDDADALLERGIIRQRQGDEGGARADWERAMALAPNTATSDLAEQNLALLEAGPERR